MAREYLCSSHTVSGVMPGSATAARHPLDDRLAACAAAGYRGYWLHFRDYLENRAAGMDDEALRGLFERYGMVHRGVEFLTDWFLDDPACREMQAAAFAAARAIGADVVNVGGDFAGRGIPRRDMVAAFARLCRSAARQEIRVALEIVPFSDVPDIISALEFLGPENAGIVVDSWHVFRGGIRLADLARLPAQRICCVQVNDAAAAPRGPLAQDTLQRKFCGEGAFDLAGFAAALDQAGVDIPFSVEIISPAVAALPVENAARLAIDSARKVFG